MSSIWRMWTSMRTREAMDISARRPAGSPSRRPIWSATRSISIGSSITIYPGGTWEPRDIHTASGGRLLVSEGIDDRVRAYRRIDDDTGD